MMRKQVLLTALASSGLVAILSCPAAAQTAPIPTSPPAAATPPTDQGQPPVNPGDIVVTARRTAEAARDVPSTITAVTVEQLEATGPVNSTGDLLRTVPGVRFNDVSASNLSEVSIRGSGTQRATGADSGVGLFVNGAYVGSSTLGGRNFKTLDYFDVKRVEVLEGPQGALYGRNAEFGVVNTVLAQPELENSGYLSETYTFDLHQNRLIGILNQQVDEDVAVRLSGQVYGQTKGFYYNPTKNTYYDQTDGYVLRGQARVRRGPLDVNFLVDGQDLDLPTFANTYVLPAGTSPQIPLGYTAPRFIVPHDGVDGLHQNVFRVMALANYDFGWGTLSSTTMAMRWSSAQQFASAIDLGTEAMFQRLGQVGVYPLGQTMSYVRDRTLYQDLHLNGTALDDRLTWLVGGEILWQRDSGTRSDATNPCPISLGSGICGGTLTNPVCYLILPTSRPCPATFPNAFGAFSVTRQRYLSEAVYGSVKYTLTDGLTASGDLRFTHDDKSAALTQTRRYTNILTSPPTDFSFKASKVNYTLSLSYQIPGAARALVYAKTGTGYRAGGINNGVSSPLAPNPFLPTYGDEDTTSYEVGFKGNPARNIYLAIDAYYARTRDAITSILDGCTVLNACKQGPTVFNINGGTVHTKGVEASLDFRADVAGGKFGLNLNGARQSGEYVDTPSGYSGLPTIGSSVAQIPDWTASATIDYRHALADNITGFFHTVYNGSWGGGQDTVTVTTPFVALDDRNQLSLRTGVNIRRFELAFFTQNLLNETIQLLKLQANNVTFSSRFNQPRTYGLSLAYRW